MCINNSMLTLQKLLSSSGAILEACGAQKESQKLQQSGRLPHLQSPSEEWLFPLVHRLHLDDGKIQKTLETANATIESFKRQVLSTFTETLHRLSSVSHLGGLSDASAERNLISIFEKRFQCFLHRVQNVLAASVVDSNTSMYKSAKRVAGFTSVSFRLVRD